MNIEQMREICTDLRNMGSEWKQFVSQLEDVLFVKQQETPFLEQQELSCCVNNLQHHCTSFFKMISILEKCVEEYSVAEKVATNLLQQQKMPWRSDAQVQMNDLTAIGQKMKPYRIQTVEQTV